MGACLGTGIKETRKSFSHNEGVKDVEICQCIDCSRIVAGWLRRRQEGREPAAPAAEEKKAEEKKAEEPAKADEEAKKEEAAPAKEEAKKEEAAPAADKAAEKPAGDAPAAEKAAGDAPAADKAAEKPAGDAPAAEKLRVSDTLNRGMYEGTAGRMAGDFFLFEPRTFPLTALVSPS